MALHLPITSRCNLRCVFCSAWGRDPEPSLEALLEQLDHALPGPVQISGGEPTLRDEADLWRVLRACRRSGRRVEFQTNALTLEHWPQERLELLCRLADTFNVNYSAHTPALERKISGAGGVFLRKERAVVRLLDLGAQVRLTHVICSFNFRSLERFVRYVHRALPGIARIQFSYVKAMGKACRDRVLVPPYRVVAPYLDRALRRCRDLGIAFDVDHIPVCFIPDFKERHVDTLKMRSRRAGPHLEEKARIPVCAGCRFVRECPGPRKDYVAIYGGL